MVCLLRNIPPLVKPPANGFENLPHPHDISDGDNIARLKYYKNVLVSHSKDYKLSNAEFGRIWTDMEQVLICISSNNNIVLHCLQ